MVRDLDISLDILLAGRHIRKHRCQQIVRAHGGGDGAARDAVEFILKAQGKWKQVVSEYICERSPMRST